ncbi:MAG: hypothetical protein ACK4GL_11780 [Flavobacteriales bacterium]
MNLKLTKYLVALCFTFFNVLNECPAQLDRKTKKNHLKAIQYSVDKNTVVVSLDTIFNRGQRYGIIIRNLQMRNDFDVKSLNGNAAFFITAANAPAGYLSLRFLDGSNRDATIPFVFGIERIAEFIVKENLLRTDGINEDAIAVFMNKYPYRERKNIIQSAVSDLNTTIDESKRNRQLKVYERNNELYQGDFLIGTFKKANENYGTDVKRVINIYFTNDDHCAKAIFDMGNSNVLIITTKDKREHYITIKGVVTAKKIAEYLVSWRYL